MHVPDRLGLGLTPSSQARDWTQDTWETGTSVTV
ncbi:hypothetical protein COL8621_03578 [Actibacterium lipolyticum]|uniref:Uncharacterized protein n=1 Tax=Actibacterium lipolyticum TaxID=1524263 RepID=A0A238L7Q7_9RHOB|nr:hypothetical protein COL8621_03578 [Actibacterium lipolyticum]